MQFETEDVEQKYYHKLYKQGMTFKGLHGFLQLDSSQQLDFLMYEADRRQEELDAGAPAAGITRPTGITFGSRKI